MPLTLSRRCFLSRRDTSPRDRLGVLSSGQSFPTSTSLLCVHYRHRVRLAAASPTSASRGDWNTSTSLPVIPRAAARAEQKARLIQDRFAPGNMRHSFASQPQIYSLSSSSVLNVLASKLFTASRYVYVCVFCAFATRNFGVYILVLKDPRPMANANSPPTSSVMGGQNPPDTYSDRAYCMSGGRYMKTSQDLGGGCSCSFFSCERSL